MIAANAPDGAGPTPRVDAVFRAGSYFIATDKLPSDGAVLKAAYREMTDLARALERAVGMERMSEQIETPATQARIRELEARCVELQYDRDALVDAACEAGCAVGGQAVPPNKGYVKNIRAESAEASCKELEANVTRLIGEMNHYKDEWESAERKLAETIKSQDAVCDSYALENQQLSDRAVAADRQLAALRLNDARYRWLRDVSEPNNPICTFYLSVGAAYKDVRIKRETVDAAIDAALDRHGAEGGKC